MTDKKIKEELERIEKYSLVGYYTFLHHNKIVEQTNNLMERIDYILKVKEPSEHYTRLRHIYPVVDIAVEIYDKAHAAAEKIFDEACHRSGKIYDKARALDWKIFEQAGATQLAWKTYCKSVAPAREAYEQAYVVHMNIYRKTLAAAEQMILAIIPVCAWNGETILLRDE